MPHEKTKFYGMSPSLMVLFALCVTSYLVYGNIFNHSFVDYDDYRIIVDRAGSYDGLTLKTLKKIFIDEFPREEPLLVRDFSYILNAAIFGTLNPGGYLLGNYLLHIAVSYIIFFLVLILFPKNYTIASLSALIFVIHPIHVESVAWISSRKDPLYTFFYLLAFVQYLKFLNTERKQNLIYSLVFFILSLFSKSAAISFFPLIICCRFCIYRQKDVSFRELIFFASILIATFLFIRWYTGILNEYGVLERSKSFFHRNWLIWLLSSCEYVTFYLNKLIFPIQSAIFYESPSSVNIYADKSYLAMSLSVVGGGILLAIIWWKNRKFSRLFLLAFFICGLLPYLELAQVNIYVAERYVYMSSIPFCIAIAFFVSHIFQIVSNNKTLNTLMIMAVIGIFVVLGYRTAQACKIWKNTMSFWENNLNVSPGRPETHTGLMRYYQKLFIYSESDTIRKYYLLKSKAIGEAALDRFCPSRENCTAIIYQITSVMAELEWNLKNFERADMFFKATFTLVPDFIESRFMYASFLTERKRFKEALEQIKYVEKHLHPYENKNIQDQLKNLRPTVEKGLRESHENHR